ncbi:MULTISPECIES: nuclear transport factor 2 family protein [unclassified Leucobacter]|jgi:hypothetical protein|uniref:nuclear transport factor 2 family protein n=1 Tax=unclassified Leucobacter TaxID=2621730 RepID=UPI003447F159
MSAFTLDELLSLEHAGWKSLCESTGGTFYGELMMPDALFVLSNGWVMTRDEIAASLNDSPAWAAYEITDVRIVEAGSDAAVLVYRATASREEMTEPYTAFMSSVYRRVDGKPRMALYQQTEAAA